MKIKPGASLQGLNLVMRPALIVADRLWKHHGQELVVTAGTDGEHSAGSLHYYGQAIDFRTNYFTETKAKMLSEELRRQLTGVDNHFQVILHSTHIHVEYDNV
jgi:hypothetical protein